MPTAARALEALAQQRFISLTTFRKSGEPVSTPVWVGWDRDALIVTTPQVSGKVKRLRNNPLVELRPCSRTGRVVAGVVPVTGTAKILSDGASRDRLNRLIRGKYRLEYLAVVAIERLGRPRGAERVILRTTAT